MKLMEIYTAVQLYCIYMYKDILNPSVNQTLSEENYKMYHVKLCVYEDDNAFDCQVSKAHFLLWSD